MVPPHRRSCSGGNRRRAWRAAAVLTTVGAGLLAACLRPEPAGGATLVPSIAARGEPGPAALALRPEPVKEAGTAEGGPDEAGLGDGEAAGDAAPDAPAVTHPFQAPMPGRSLLASSRATRYASLSPGACMTALRARKLPVKRARRAARGVATPLNLTGPLQGVLMRTAPPNSPYGIVDCRLVLALDDFAQILARHGVAEVRIDNTYRPRARLAGRRKLSQHAYGLAADITSLVLGDGRTLVVERDWHGTRGAPACGPEAVPEGPTEETILLRNLVCEIAREGIFHHMLTGNYDTAHEKHFHFDIQRGSLGIGVR